MESDSKWWKVQVGSREGYAAKFYFAPKVTPFKHEKEPWFFHDVSEKEAENLLKESINPDGSFLIRKSKDELFLSLKSFNKASEGQGEFKYLNFRIESDGTKFWFGITKFHDKKLDQLGDLINLARENASFFGKITNVCLLPSPHSDPDFAVATKKGSDPIEVPLSELKPNIQIGTGQFGNVYKARFRTLDVAAKQLKVDDKEEEESAKVVEEFFSEICIMKKFNHPNLVHLFGYITNERRGNFLIVEFMANGDVKALLKKLKSDPERMEQKKQVWSKLVRWCLDAARGMEHLDRLNIVHRDLAARCEIIHD